MKLVTTLGEFAANDLGAILPHEHVVADLRPLDEREDPSNHSIATIRDLIEPEVRAALSVGVTAIVEASPIGVGRRADAIEAISAETGMPFVVATGVYRAPWVPSWVRELTSSELTDWMLRELEDHIDGTTTRAGWIKLSAGDDGMTAEEERILRAAARAAIVAGCAIGSHTVTRRCRRVAAGCSRIRRLSAAAVRLDPRPARTHQERDTSTLPDEVAGSSTTGSDGSRRSTSTSPWSALWPKRAMKTAFSSARTADVMTRATRREVSR